MPAFTDQTRPIDSQAQLDELCDGLTDKITLALDTEFVRTDTYYPGLCLIQMATNTDIVCIDTLAELDYGPLTELLTHGSGLKILHAAKQDLEAFISSYGRLPEPIFDTQVGAGLLGHQAQIGYGNLVQNVIGVQLEKGQTRTDWSQRPLTPAQLKYACDDVRYLAELHSRQKAALESSGRYAWALEDSAALVDPKLYAAPPAEAWRRLSKVPYLPPPAQACARQLATWRENRAQKVNRPRQWVLPDKGLLAIAEANPSDPRELFGLPDVPDGIARRQGESLINELRQANADLESGCIQLSQKTKPETPDARALKHLAGIVGNKADELGISPELLTTRRDLTALLRGERNIKPLTGWRMGVIGEALLQAL